MSMSPQEFRDKFSEFMLPGLDSVASYIPLRTSKSLGINVAIRPYVQRVSEEVILYGVKLRVGYTMDENYEIQKKSAVSINEDAAAERLKDFCKGFSWLKGDARRFSTVVGIAVAATTYDKDTALKVLETNKLAVEFINRLEAKYKENNKVGFSSKRKVIEILNAAWIMQSNMVFSNPPEIKQLPEGVVGMSSGVLNQAQDTYHDNVVSFKDKVAAMAAADEELDSE